jgi:hypothetical protein
MSVSDVVSKQMEYNVFLKGKSQWYLLQSEQSNQAVQNTALSLWLLRSPWISHTKKIKYKPGKHASRFERMIVPPIFTKYLDVFSVGILRRRH